MKSDKIVLYLLAAVTLIMFIFSVRGCAKYQRLNQQKDDNDAIISSMNIAVSQENKLMEDYQKNIATLVKESASYEAAFAKEDRAEAVKESMEAVISSMNNVDGQLSWERESLRAVWENLCRQLNIEFETEEATEREAEYDE